MAGEGSSQKQAAGATAAGASGSAGNGGRSASAAGTQSSGVAGPTGQACILDPEHHYTWKYNDNDDDVDLLTDVMARIADSPREAMQAMAQFEFFRTNQGRFRGEMAHSAASMISASTWWHQYGGEVKILQKYAMRIVSQCVSSSGCERNWSTFALIHTNVRNRLSYEKLHKLVYAHYNLKLRIHEHEIERQRKELDPFSMIMDASTLFDEDNSMMDWMNSSMGETNQVLDEGDQPSQVVVEEIDKEEERLKRKFCDIGRKQKRKTRTVSSLTRKPCNKKGKKILLDEEDEFVDSDDDADSENDEEEGDCKEESEGEEERDSEEERDGEEERDVLTRRSKRGNRKKKDPYNIYY